MLVIYMAFRLELEPLRGWVRSQNSEIKLVPEDKLSRRSGQFLGIRIFLFSQEVLQGGLGTGYWVLGRLGRLGTLKFV